MVHAKVELKGIFSITYEDKIDINFIIAIKSKLMVRIEIG